MCQPQGAQGAQGARLNPQSLEQGLGVIRAILAGQGGNGLGPLPSPGQGQPGMAPAPPASGPQAHGGVGLLQPAGTAPSPALGLSFLAQGVRETFPFADTIDRYDVHYAVAEHPLLRAGRTLLDIGVGL